MPSEHRLYFSKTGTARYISHLDLMRTFQRAFLRAGITIRHTEGYHPHAFVSLPLPLSTGFSSECEVLDFELVSGAPMQEVPGRMNAALPAGITVERCYEAERKVKELTYVRYRVTLDYENGVPAAAGERVRELFSRVSLPVSKKSKKSKDGQVTVDVIPLIRSFDCTQEGSTLVLDTVIRAQNPGLNPEVLVTAIRTECPDLAPDYVAYHRVAMLDAAGEIWE